MLRIKTSNRVRRKLFHVEDSTEEAKTDNFANILQESIARDKVEKSKKWNFDFENERPLEGTYQWFPCESTDWIGIESQTECKENEEESFFVKKMENEATPTTKDGEYLPIFRKKRKNTAVTIDKNVRRKISFD